MKKIIIVLSIAFTLSIQAVASKEVGNGGDVVSIDFQSSFERALVLIKNKSLPNLKPILKINFKKRIPELKVITVDKPLEIEVGDSIQESTAVNYPKNQLIKVNRDRWNSIQLSHLKEGIALHEMLSLLGIEGTGKYEFSAQYAEAMGIGRTDLERKYRTRTESARFQIADKKYELIATVRDPDNPGFFDDYKIDYSVFVNGQLMSPKNSGESMYTCSGAGSELPKNFIKVIEIDEKPVGFYLFGGGICGNTYSLRYRIIIPHQDTSGNVYSETTFLTKGPPVAKSIQGAAHFWYTYQEWGTCGTSGSFFVPQLIKWNGRDFQNESLPKDLKEFPTFDYYYPGASIQVQNFPSLFTAGLVTLDAEFMKVAMDFYETDSESQKWYEWCGLPTTVEEANKKIESMRIISGDLKNFIQK